MNVALDKLPEFTCLKQQERAGHEHLTGGIVIGDTLEYLDNAFYESKSHGWSKAPIVEMLIPSTLDNTLAPEGKHVASLFCQHFDPDVNGQDGDWDTHRDMAVEAILDTVEKHAPGFKDSILGMQVLSPLDLDRLKGCIFAALVRIQAVA